MVTTFRFLYWLLGNGKTKTGRLWTYVRDDRPAGSSESPAVWFAYSPDRKSEHPADHLKTFHGTLQADGFAGFNRLYETGSVIEAACWAHVRRKFHDLYEAHASPIAKEALERIGALYGIEKEIRGRPPDDRQQIRNAQARPLLESLYAWLKASLSKLSRKSDVAVAIHYALGRWTQLLRYCDDGRLEIDNNSAERALRAVALGRKNYLFAGSNAGGERAAAIYSLIGSAKLNGIDPEAYLSHVLACIADHPIPPHPRTPALECGTGNNQRPNELIRSVRNCHLRTLLAPTTMTPPTSTRYSPDAY
jgi:transposase